MRRGLNKLISQLFKIKMIFQLCMVQGITVEIRGSNMAGSGVYYLKDLTYHLNIVLNHNV